MAVQPELVAVRPGQVLLADKNYDGGEFERVLAGWVCGCCGRPAGRGKAGRRVLFKPLRQLIESVNQTSRGSWTWNATAAGPWWVWVWVLQRTLALTAAIWHNDKTGQPTLRSLVAYDN